MRQEYNYKYKNTSAFQASWDLKTSGKNTTITRKNVDFPFVKNKGSFSFNLDYESPSFGTWEYDWRIGYETATSINLGTQKVMKEGLQKLLDRITR